MKKTFEEITAEVRKAEERTRENKEKKQQVFDTLCDFINNTFKQYNEDGANIAILAAATEASKTVLNFNHNIWME